MEFVISDGVLVNIRGKGELKGEVVIPDGVRIIGESVFSGAYDITSVIIPEGVEEIEKWAFNQCERLENVVLPSSLRLIGYAAFLGCDSLHTILLPENVCEVGSLGSSFSRCDGLREINVHPHNKKYSDIDGVLVSKDKTVLIFVPNGYSAEEYIVPDSIEIIKPYAFGSKYVKRIIIPEYVKSFGEPLFLRSASIEEVVIRCPYYTSVKICFINFSGKRIVAPEIDIEYFEDPKLKHIAVLGYAKAWLTGMTTDSPENIKYERYIRRQKKRLYKFAAEDIWLMRYMIERRLIPAADIDRILEQISDKNVEIRALLMEYFGGFNESAFDKMYKL